MNLTPALQHCSCCSPTPHTQSRKFASLLSILALFLSVGLVPEDGVQPPRTAVCPQQLLGSGLPEMGLSIISPLEITACGQAELCRSVSGSGHLPNLFPVAPFCAAFSNSRLTPPQTASETSFQRMVINLQEGLRPLAMTQPCNSVAHLEFHEVKHAASILRPLLF